jgi:uncharacterized protein with GYD domain
MRRWLVESRCSVEGLKQIREKGGTHERNRLAALMQAIGGSLEVQYFTLGGHYRAVWIPADDAAWASYSVAEIIALDSTDVIGLIDNATRR